MKNQSQSTQKLNANATNNLTSKNAPNSANFVCMSKQAEILQMRKAGTHVNYGPGPNQGGERPYSAIVLNALYYGGEVTKKKETGCYNAGGSDIIRGGRNGKLRTHFPYNIWLDCLKITLPDENTNQTGSELRVNICFY